MRRRAFLASAACLAALPVSADAAQRVLCLGGSLTEIVYALGAQDRLIARDTIEEKVLELQTRKRDLADAIITADNSLIGSLQREDLELLLS